MTKYPFCAEEYKNYVKHFSKSGMNYMLRRIYSKYKHEEDIIKLPTTATNLACVSYRFRDIRRILFHVEDEKKPDCLYI